MLTHAEEKLIRSLHRKKGRKEEGLCLVEGRRVIDAAGKAVEWTFTPNDTPHFSALVTTETPQPIAGVARIPEWSTDDIISRPTIILLDGVQDPGNVGAILRLCAGFRASLLLVESADVASPKVVRASAGVLFTVPWQEIPREKAPEYIQSLSGYTVFRLEKKAHDIQHASLQKTINTERMLCIAGSEGRGIQLPYTAPSLTITHEPVVESLNVSHAVAIVLHARYHAPQTKKD